MVSDQGNQGDYTFFYYLSSLSETLSIISKTMQLALASSLILS